MKKRSSAGKREIEDPFCFPPPSCEFKRNCNITNGSKRNRKKKGCGLASFFTPRSLVSDESTRCGGMSEGKVASASGGGAGVSSTSNGSTSSGSGGGGGAGASMRTSSSTSSTSSSGAGGAKKKKSSAVMRLMSDLRDLQEDPPEGCSAAPASDDNLFVWNASIIGPDESPWEGGIYSLRVSFPEQYPVKPPKVRFTCEMFHPNVYADGTLCLDIIQDQWSAIYTVGTILTSIQSLLTDPNPASPANPDAAKVSRKKQAGRSRSRSKSRSRSRSSGGRGVGGGGRKTLQIDRQARDKCVTEEIRWSKRRGCALLDRDVARFDF